MHRTQAESKSPKPTLLDWDKKIQQWSIAFIQLKPHSKHPSIHQGNSDTYTSFFAYILSFVHMSIYNTHQLWSDFDAPMQCTARTSHPQQTRFHHRTYYSRGRAFNQQKTAAAMCLQALHSFHVRLW